MSSNITTLLGAAHKFRITSLYRRSLKLTHQWAVNRDLFLEEAWKVREQFRSHMNETDPKRIEYLIQKAEAKLYELRHPDPYIRPESPGGSKWQRNTPPPLRLCDPHAQHYFPSETNLFKKAEH
eukprot:TRINITY_DN130658_c0_g1_i1.p1 TRINITY_DN130658_c0_g1~~TRINITY_DN130658_c0_g1_i1.p1  ORF type:complete len:124 (-),score=26.13 TRINITY_DN130658_c0_g1_i1:26-397(-)